ncbi:sperm flagellar protein 2 isoform X1 [Podarcis muralis]
MKNELDRFQDTKRLLHDYYRGMEGKIPTETSNEFTRIPLIDLTDKEQPMEEAKTRIIPLSVHRAASPEPKDKMKAIPVKIKEDVFSESIIFNFAPEEKQITEMWHNIVATISNMVTAEIQAKEAEEEKERLQQEMKEKERQKSSQAEKKGKEGKGKKGKGGKEAKGGKDAKGGKGGKDAKGKEGKDAKGKKGKKKASHSPPEPTPTPIPLSPEELKKLELRLKMKQEYFAALEHEAEAAKSRLELLKAKALAFTEDLQTKAEVTYRNMEKWLGERFLAEMSSVDILTEVARHHIETSTKIQYELVLEGVEFYINGDVKVFPDPLPPPRPPSVEMPTNGTLTISQLSTLHKQFLQVAPKAIAALKQFKSKNITPGIQKQPGKNHQFQQIWLSKYPWLKHDSERGTMYCALCRKHNVDLGEKTHNFCSGTDDFVLELVNDHHNSEAHAWATCMEAASGSVPDTATTEQMLKSMSKTTLGRIENLFRTCHAIAKTGRPITDLDWMCKLDDMKGVDIGSIFRNDKAARIFIHFIAEVERRALKEKLEKCKFFSLISDGVTDSTIREAALVYVRFALQGKIHCQIVGVQSVDKRDAAAVKNAIVQTLQTSLQLNLPNQDWARKLVGFGSGGGDIMVGQSNGVAKLLKEIQPCVQSVHCLVHHLEIAYKAALKSTQLYTILTELLQNMYYYYNSPLNKNDLKLVYEDLNLRTSIPSRIGGSRWLLRLQTALQILLKGYPAFVLHMSKVEEEPCSSNHQKAKDLLKLLLKTDIVKFSHFLLDVINVLNILSRVVQDQNSSIADVFATSQSTLETLQMYRARSGPRERLVEAITHFHGHQLVGDGDISAIRIELISNLLKQLRDCFCDASEDVLRASAIGSFKLWPDKIEPEFGEVEVSVLMKYYEPVLECANVKIYEVETEWNMLKAELYDRYQSIRRLTWEAVNTDYFHKYPNILTLVDLVLTLPASSDKAARGFCQMKLTMMRLRSKLVFESMTDRMVILMNSPDIKKFDPRKAIQLWNISSQRNRRLQAEQGVVNPETPDCSSDSEWERERESSFGSY